MLLSAPRRTAATPNQDGTLAIFGVSTYSFESQKKNLEIRVLDISSGQSRLVNNEEKTSSPTWIGSGNELLWLKSGEKGVTEIRIGDADEAGRSYVAGVVPAPVSDVKLKSLDDNKVAIALTAEATPDGSFYNPEAETKKRSSARLYDNVFVRHWDKYITPNRNAIFHGILQRGEPHITESKGRYTLGEMTNVLKGSRLESPIPPFGGSEDFDLSIRGVGFVARDPDLNPAFNTRSNFYFVRVEDTAHGLNYSKPVKIVVEGFEGASSAPSLEPNGEGAAFLQMKENGYESDKNRVILVADVTLPDSAFEIFQDYDGNGLWDRSPSSITWSNNGRTLYFTAEDEGRAKLFKVDIPASPLDMTILPDLISSSGSISTVQALSHDSSNLFLSSTSLIDNSVYSILDPEAPDHAMVVSSNSRNGSFFGLSPDQVSDIWFDGAGSQKVHAWLIKPSNFEEGKSYPLAYLIHGGPQGSWLDSWSTRWNSLVFAEQGYIVIAPNPTGSTGYGQAFTDAIRDQWGGLPYEDLVKGFEYIKKNLDFVDTDRAVALGASYGGYMMNWIQGHALGKEFKAIVVHDGSFNIPAQLASDEQYFPNHDFAGRYDSANKSSWDKWSPVNYISEWSTPMLVIHNELDYRLPISEGLAVFNVLQERGIKSRFLSFPDENHWVIQPENSLVWHTVVINWINEHVGLPKYKDEAELGVVVQN